MGGIFLSPDGSKVVFHAYLGGAYRVNTMSMATGAITQGPQYHYGGLDWSADSQNVVFAMGGIANWNLGTNAVTMLLSAGDLDGCRYLPVYPDTVPPSTTVSFSPTANAAGWHNTSVTATFTASDPSPGTGVKQVRSTVNSGPEQVDSGASGTRTLSAEGIHTLAYWSVDHVNNVETTKTATVKIDKTAPTLSNSRSGSVLTLGATDTLSGVAWVKYKLDNGAEQTYSGPITVPSTVYNVTFRAQDIAGNTTAPQTIPIKSYVKRFTLTPGTTAFAGASVVVKVELAAAAPSGGIAVSLTSSHPSILPLPASLTVPAGALSASTTVVLGPVSAATSVRVDATENTWTASAGLAVLVPQPKSLTFAPSIITGGASGIATVTLMAKAPAGGQVVTLMSFDPGVMVPASVTIPAGVLSAKFTVATTVVTADKAALITAASGGTTVANSMTVRPIAPRSLTITPSSVKGGASTLGKVTLNRPAPAGGLVVTLSSTNSGANVGPSVTVPAGATSQTFPVTTTPVSALTVVGISASAGGVTATGTVTVLP